jgi:FKBP-type peptidyl-prolyl cis-trans isomerase
MRVASVISVLMALVLGLTACGGGDSTAETASGDSAAAQEAPVQAAGGDWATLKRFAGPNADKLIVPQGPSPDHVVIKDLKVGNGPTIKPGDIFFSDYISWSYESGKPVEPTPESNGQLTWVPSGSLIWGTGERVPGWEPGLKGIRVGGLRELIVPSRLAYENGPRVYLVKVTKIEPR